jgi:hypothetical protein
MLLASNTHKRSSLFPEPDVEVTVDATTITSIIDFIQNNLATMLVVLVAGWLSLFVLRVLFMLVVHLIGWMGYYVVAALPGAITYYATHHLLGHGTDQATWQAIATAVLIGLVANVFGLSDNS